jgi:hypothetical protein
VQQNRPPFNVTCVRPCESLPALRTCGAGTAIGRAIARWRTVCSMAPHHPPAVLHSDKGDAPAHSGIKPPAPEGTPYAAV